MSGAVDTCEGEKLLIAKFNLSRSHTSSGGAPTAGCSTAVGPTTVSEESPAPAESMSRAASAAGGAGPRCTDVKRLELGVEAVAGAECLSMADQMRTEVEVLSHVHHIVTLLGSIKDGMVSCLMYALMEDGSYQDL
jgi:hypothetical protein